MELSEKDWLVRYEAVESSLRLRVTRGDHPFDASVMAVMDMLRHETLVPGRIEQTYRVLQKLNATADSAQNDPASFAGAMVEAVIYCMPSESPHMAEVRKGQEEARQDAVRARSDAEHHLEALKRRLDEALEASIRRAEDAAQAAADAARSAGAEVRMKEFGERANEHRKAAHRWLVGALVGFGGWVGVAYHIAMTMRRGAAWPDVAVRVLGLSAGLAMVGVLIRAYTANVHNAVVNEHRSTAINTMRSFIAATSDEATKNAVILQVTSGTFAPLPTGYEWRGGLSVPQTQVVELLKSGRRPEA